MRQIKKSPEPAHFINWKHNFKAANGRDAIYDDLFADKDYVEAVVEDYDNMQDGEYAEFCSMITYCLREYYMPK